MSETTTATTPPAAATPPPAAAPAAPAAAPSWHDGASADNLGWIQNKGFKSPLDVVESARNLEKLMGHPPEKILKLADKMRDDAGALTPEGRAIFERLGAPKDAKDYTIEIPKEYGDASMAEMFRKLFHEEGVSKSSAERLVKEWNAYQTNAMKGIRETQELAAKTAEANLKKDWGQAYDQNLNIAKEAARTLGVDQKQLDALHHVMGQEGAMKLMHKLGASVGEGRFVKGGSPNAVVEPSNAQYQIRELMKDKEFGRKLAQGDSEATARWTRLHEMAHPGQFSVGPTMI